MSDNWQPISEAPKNGSNIIATKFGWVIDDLTSWTGVYHGPWWISKAHWHEEQQCWSNGFERLCEPTHFKPIGEDLPDVEIGPNGCDIAPSGWFCTREKGHEGPCAAHPTSDALSGKSYSFKTYKQEPST